MRRTLLYYITVFLLSILCTQSNAQTVEDSLLKRIAYYQEVDSFERYYKSVYQIEKFYINNEDLERFKSSNHFYHKEPKNNLDSLALRYNFMHRGNRMRKYIGDLDKAKDLYEKAHELLPTDTVDSYIWYVENPLANLYARLNDYDQALYFQNRIHPYLSDSKKARQLKNIGDLQLWTGDTTESIKAYEKGLRLNDSLKIKRTAFVNTLALANVYSLKKQENLFQKYIKLSEDYLSQDSEDFQYRDLLLLIGDHSFRKNDLSQTVKLYRQAIKTYTLNENEGESRELAKIHVKIAEVYFAENDIPKVNTELKLALKKVTNENGDIDNLMENTLVDIYRLLAKSRMSEKNSKSNLESALDYSLKAIEINRLLDQELLIKQSRLISIEKNRELVEVAINLLYRLQEFGKVDYELVDEMFAMSKDVKLAQEVQFRSRLENLKVVELEKVNEILLQLRNPSLNNKIKVKLHRSLSALMSRSGHDGTDKRSAKNYLEYVVIENNIYLFTDIGGERIYKLDNVQSEVNFLLKMIESKANLKQLKRSCKDLYKKLIPIKLDDRSTLSIYSDSYLNLVPFEILRVDDKYLIELVEIGYKNHTKKTVASNEYKGMLCMAPEYNGEENSTRAGFGDLQYATEEVKKIKTIEKLQCIQVDSAFSEFLFDEGNEYDILHYAGHAKTKDDESYIALPSNGNQIKIINSESIVSSKRNHKLVTLSACESGLGKFRYGDGLESLARSFLASGVSSVLYSLWAVNDRSTSDLMYSFYINLGKGLAKDRALQQAKIEFLSLASPEMRHPYYWAGFVLAGDTLAIDFEKERTCKYLLFYVLILALFIFLFKMFK